MLTCERIVRLETELYKGGSRQARYQYQVFVRLAQQKVSAG